MPEFRRDCWKKPWRRSDVGARLEISRVVRSGISATKVDVWVDGEKDLPREEYWAKQRCGAGALARELSPRA